MRHQSYSFNPLSFRTVNDVYEVFAEHEHTEYVTVEI